MKPDVLRLSKHFGEIPAPAWWHYQQAWCVVALLSWLLDKPNTLPRYQKPREADQ